MSLFSELKRRNVLRVGLGYLAVAWLFIQITETIFPLFGLPDSAARLVVLLFAAGFVPVLVFAWIFEFTPEGLKLEHDIDRTRAEAAGGKKRFDRWVMLLLGLAVGYFMFDKFVLDPARDADRAAEIARQARSEALSGSYGDRSIAVLPFMNLSDDRGNEFFAEGVSEELLNLLAKVPELRVISRSSSFTFRGQSVDIPTVAEKLHVAHVLEGSVRKAGNRVRITAQLIEAGSDTHLWSETYDRTLNDIFAVQDEIAAEVVRQLKVTLLGSPARTDAVDPQAYSDYLQARFLANQYDPSTMAQAEDLLRNVLKREPDYVPALLELATVYVRRYHLGSRSLQDTEDLYRQAVAHARVLKPQDPLVLSYIASTGGLFDKDLSETAPGIAEAFSLDPQNSDIAYQALRMARMTGRNGLAISIGEYLITLDPLCARCHYGLGRAYLTTGRYADAEAMMRKTLVLGQGWFSVHFMLGLIQLLQHQPQAALAEFEQAEDETARIEGRAMVMFELGHQAEFEAALEALRSRESGDERGPVFAWAGQKDEAFEWLEQSLQEQPDRFAEIFSDPLYFKLHGDPRWHAFLEQVGEAPEQLAAIEFDVEVPGRH